MICPLNRDELARHLYIHAEDDEYGDVPACGRRHTEWGEGMVTDQDRADCYAQADQLLAEGATR